MDPNIDPQADIVALAGYAPRQAAIEMILAGRFDDYLAWARGDGYLAAHGQAPADPERIDLGTPLPLDEELLERISRGTPNGDHAAVTRLNMQAFETIPHLGQSPVEIALRRASPPVVGAILAAVSDPRHKFKVGYGVHPAATWPAWRAQTYRQADRRASLLIPLLGRMGRYSADDKPLLLLPLLQGKLDVALTMLRSGLVPDHAFRFDELARVLRETQAVVAADPQAMMLLRRALDVPADHLAAAARWLEERARLGDELEALLADKDKDYAAVRDRAIALLEQGAPVGEMPLMVATRHNDLDMLRRLFAAGANPNGTTDSRTPFLTAVLPDEPSTEALQVWLDAGAQPGRGDDPGDEENPSPLLAAIYRDRLDHFRQMATRSRGPVTLVEKRKGRRHSPWLELAREESADSIADWLVKSDFGLRDDQVSPAG